MVASLFSTPLAGAFSIGPRPFFILWVDLKITATVEIFASVAGDGGVCGSGDGGDLAVSLGDGAAGRAKMGCTLGIGFGGRAIDWQHAPLRILIDHRVDGQLQPVAALAVR